MKISPINTKYKTNKNTTPIKDIASIPPFIHILKSRPHFSTSSRPNLIPQHPHPRNIILKQLLQFLPASMLKNILSEPHPVDLDKGQLLGVFTQPVHDLMAPLAMLPDAMLKVSLEGPGLLEVDRVHHREIKNANLDLTMFIIVHNAMQNRIRRTQSSQTVFLIGTKHFPRAALLDGRAASPVDEYRHQMRISRNQHGKGVIVSVIIFHITQIVQIFE